MRAWVAFAVFLSFATASRAETGRRKVEIEWKPIEHAEKYELIVMKDGEELARKTTSGTEWSGELAPGFYSYKLRAIDRVNRPGVWSADQPLVIMPEAPIPESPKDGAELVTLLPKSSIELKWAPVPGANEYRVQLLSKGKVVADQTVAASTVKVEGLPPGDYGWNVRAVIKPSGRAPASLQSRAWEGSPGKTFDFEIEQKPLDAPKGLSPKGRVPPPTTGKMGFSWKKVEGADGYEFTFRRADGAAGWGAPIVTRSTKAEFPVSLDGVYEWKVRALASIDEKGAAAVQGPETDAEIKIDRNALFVEGTGYLAFSTMVSPYTYEAVSETRSYSGSTNSVAIVGRLSGEYWVHPYLGLATGIDSTVFQISSTTQNRLAAELLLKSRFSLNGDRNGWILAPRVGYELREYFLLIPEKSRTGRRSVTSVSTGKFFAQGASPGIDIRKQLSAKWSLGGYVRYFVPLGLIKAPDGGRVAATASFRNISGGLQAFYWFKPGWGVGLGGHYDNRSISYVTPSGATDRVYMDAFYFFASLLYSFR